ETWINGTVCCEWDGVTCDIISGHVMDLNLSLLNLQGQSYPNCTIFSLSHLQQLDLSSNYFFGDISSTISHLSKLQSLDLSFNSLNVIANLFVFLSRLSYYLTDTKLDGKLPTESLLPNLIRLYLNTNEKLRVELSTKHSRFHWPFEILATTHEPIGEFSSYSFKYLSLSKNKLQGNFPNLIFELQNLVVLSLSPIDLDKLFPSPMICHFHSSILTKTVHIALHAYESFPNVLNCAPLGMIPSNWFCKSHRNLSFQLVPRVWNDTTREGVNYFHSIDLSNNMFEGEHLKVIGELHSLKGLNLSHNAITGIIPRSFGNLRNLE
ncbi:Leucine-rich repeat receptor-like serine/threonine-protein kinase BAM1, partial [Glycine soja]